MILSFIKHCINWRESKFNPWDASDSNKKPQVQKFSNSSGFGGGSGSNNFGGGTFFKNFFNSDKSFVYVLLCGLFFIWFLSGAYIINQNEQGVITRFGKYSRTLGPGLHIKFQYPIEKLTKLQTTTVQKMQIGSTNGDSYYADGLMLTGDENIVDINFEIQWRIKNPQNFLFNISNPLQTIRSSTESSMREIVGRTPISFILSTGRLKVEQEAKDLTQKILDSYNSGIEVVLVQLLRTDPPQQVIDSFRDVQTAKADKERHINQAEAYKNSVLPKARGEADKMIEEAKAYKSVVIADAEGKAKRFNDIYNQYKNSQDVTKKRIYLETMEKIMQNNDVVIVDKSSAAPVPYFNIDQKTQKASPTLPQEKK